MKLSEYTGFGGWQVIEIPTKEEIKDFVEIKKHQVNSCGICQYCGSEGTIESNLNLELSYDYSNGEFVVNVLTICNACLAQRQTSERHNICTSCESLATKVQKITIDGVDQSLCRACLRKTENIEICSVCHRVEENGSMKHGYDMYLQKEAHICNICSTFNFVCPSCGRYNGIRRVSYTTKIDGNLTKVHGCNGCISESVEVGYCITCEGAFSVDLLENGRCKKCAMAIKKECSNCGGSNGTKHDMCDWCRMGRMHEWKYIPEEFIFYGNGNVHYGLELEITGFKGAQIRERYPSGSKLKCALELYANSMDEQEFYLMQDSTINGGIEIVFHPRSIDDWFAEGRKVLNKVIEISKKHGAVSYTGGFCGIHIHRSIVDLNSKLLTATLMYSIQAIEPYAYIIAQRTSMTNVVDSESGCLIRKEYGNFMRLKETFPDDDVSDLTQRDIILNMDQWLMDIRDDHHSAITFGVDKETIELRIFRGTLNDETIMAYLSFYDLISKWAKTVSLTTLMRRQQSTNWHSFSDFVKTQHCEQSKVLKRYAKSKGVYL